MTVKKNKYNYAMYAISFFSLLCGGCIYLLFRSDSLLMFNWIEILHLKSFLFAVRESIASFNAPDFFKYALPDGLWSLSYVLFIDTLWLGSNKGWLYASFIPGIGFFSEILQYLGVLQGTFDFLDAIFYVSPYVIFYMIKYFFFKKKELMKKGKLAITFITILFFVFLALGSSDGKSSQTETAANYGPKVGDEVTITDNCIGAISEDAFNQLNKYAAAKDYVGAKQLLDKGLVRNIGAESKGKLIAVHFGSKEVRLYADQQIWWISTEFVR